MLSVASATHNILAAPADCFDKASPGGHPPEAADDLSRPNLTSLALLRAELREAVAVHVRLNEPGDTAMIGQRGEDRYGNEVLGV